ncbi:MAG: hypothetical protein HY290_03800 [Planctomycetia bacterium]|nr:hypothetical protein [Planctomycetia bacterium]
MAKLPTAKQIHYLYDLGYDGLRPQTLEEASAAIDAMKATGHVKDAEQAIRAVRRLHAGGGCVSAFLGCITKSVVASVIIFLAGLAVVTWWGRDKKPDPAEREVKIPQPVRQEREPQSPAAQPGIEEPGEPPAAGKDVPDLEGPEAITQDTEESRKEKAREAAKKLKADAEKQAQAHLKAAKSLMSVNRKAALRRLQEVVNKWPDTEAAKEAKKMLK